MKFYRILSIGSIAGVLLVVIAGVMTSVILQQHEDQQSNQIGRFWQTTPTLLPSPTPVPFKTPGSQAQIDLPFYEAQTFNNCGPATLAMMMHWAGKPVTQEVLGQQMRPYQTQFGDNDDKSVSSEEILYWAQEYGLYAIHRPGGDRELIQTFLANGIPVMVTSWLHPGEDIGHFRILTGFNDAQQTFFHDDSYDGPDLQIDYETFHSMWQPFQYEFYAVTKMNQRPLVEAILGDRLQEDDAWQLTRSQAKEELKDNHVDIYAGFNLAVAEFHLGNYQESIDQYERVSQRLPRRMLWYQVEPIKAYLNVNEYQKVLDLTAKILDDENRAYAELYLLRGAVYDAQGDLGSARHEYEQAVHYNKNLPAAQRALQESIEERARGHLLDPLTR